MANFNSIVAISDTNSATLVGQLNNKQLYPSKKWFSLGMNKLDGTWNAIPADISNVEVGWYSNDLSDYQGEFSVPIEIRGYLDENTMHGIRIVGDAESNNFPVDFTIRWFSSSVEIASKTVIGNDNPDYILWERYDDVDEIRIEISKIAYNVTDYPDVVFRDIYITDLVTTLPDVQEGEARDIKIYGKTIYNESIQQFEHVTDVTISCINRFKISDLLTNPILRSLPNESKDEISDRFYKNISDGINLEPTFTGELYKGGVNVDLVKINKSNFDNTINTADITGTRFFVSNFSPRYSNPWDSVDSIGKCFENADVFNLIVEKNKYANYTEAINDLALSETIVYYKLLIPIETPLKQLPTLQVAPNTPIQIIADDLAPEMELRYPTYEFDLTRGSECRLLEIAALLEDEYIDEQMVSPLRQIYAKVEIDFSNPFIDYEYSIAATETDAATDVNQLINKISTPSKKWFSLGMNKLDGTWNAIPADISNVEVGWYSNDLSNDSGVFSTPPIITLNLTAQPSFKLSMVGDILVNNFPVDFNLKLYSGVTLVQTQEVRGNTKVTYSLGLAINAIDKVEIEILKINTPNAKARLLEVTSSVSNTFFNDSIFSIYGLEELDYFDGNIPIGKVSANEVDIVLHNKNNLFSIENEESPYFGLLKKNRRVKVWFGVEDENEVIIWKQYGEFFTNNWKVNEETLEVILSGRDVLELLRTSEFYDYQTVENTNLGTIYETIFNAYTDTPISYNIESSLYSVPIKVFFLPKSSFRDALDYVSSAYTNHVYTDREGVIQVKEITPTLTDMDFEYNNTDNIFSRTTPLAWKDIVNKIILKGSQYTRRASKEIVKLIYDPLVIKAGTTQEIDLQFTDLPVYQPVIDTFTYDGGLTINSSNLYSWGMRLNVTNSTGGDLSITAIDIEAYLYDSTSLAVTAQDSTLIAEDGEIKVELGNNFFQNEDTMKLVANRILDLYKDFRLDIEMETRGHINLPLGSEVLIKNTSNNIKKHYVIQRMVTRWSGGFDQTIEALPD